jgi:hypothetical protein
MNGILFILYAPMEVIKRIVPEPSCSVQITVSEFGHFVIFSMSHNFCYGVEENIIRTA